MWRHKNCHSNLKFQKNLHNYNIDKILQRQPPIKNKLCGKVVFHSRCSSSFYILIPLSHLSCRLHFASPARLIDSFKLNHTHHPGWSPAQVFYFNRLTVFACDCTTGCRLEEWENDSRSLCPCLHDWKLTAAIPAGSGNEFEDLLHTRCCCQTNTFISQLSKASNLNLSRFRKHPLPLTIICSFIIFFKPEEV